MAASRTVAHTAARSKKCFHPSESPCSGATVEETQRISFLLAEGLNVSQIHCSSSFLRFVGLFLFLSVVEEWGETRIRETLQFTFVLGNKMKNDSFQTRRKL